MDTVSTTETLGEPPPVRSRGYQLEMMEAGMQRNIIVAVGSNDRNHIACFLMRSRWIPVVGKRRCGKVRLGSFSDADSRVEERYSVYALR